METERTLHRPIPEPFDDEYPLDTKRVRSGDDDRTSSAMVRPAHMNILGMAYVAACQRTRAHGGEGLQPDLPGLLHHSHHCYHQNNGSSSENIMME